MAAWGDDLASNGPSLCDDVLASTNALIEELWEGDQPPPSTYEVVALSLLTDQMGVTEQAHCISMQLLVPMLALPAPMRRMIEVNIAEGSYRFIGPVDFALPDM
jgi:hypothetical protein